jgi:hypothetical protein
MWPQSVCAGFFKHSPPEKSGKTFIEYGFCKMSEETDEKKPGGFPRLFSMLLVRLYWIRSVEEIMAAVEMEFWIYLAEY